MPLLPLNFLAFVVSTTSPLALKCWGEFVEIWHKETSSFYFSVRRITITLDDVVCMLHLPIRGRLFNHSGITHHVAIKWMVEYLSAQLEKAVKQCSSTNGSHEKFLFLKDLYHDHLVAAAISKNEGDDFFVQYHCQCTLRCYLMFLVDTSFFMDKSSN